MSGLTRPGFLAAKVFGAPLGEADAKTIADYLARSYGRPR
jgi:hypothetical protein